MKWFVLITTGASMFVNFLGHLSLLAIHQGKCCLLKITLMPLQRQPKFGTLRARLGFLAPLAGVDEKPPELLGT